MRSLLLGNGFEINFNSNMQYEKIIELVIEHKEEFNNLLNIFLKQKNIENFKFYFYLHLFNITNDDIYNFILKNIIFLDKSKSIEDNLNTIFNDVENYFRKETLEKIKKDEKTTWTVLNEIKEKIKKETYYNIDAELMDFPLISRKQKLNIKRNIGSDQLILNINEYYYFILINYFSNNKEYMKEYEIQKERYYTQKKLYDSLVSRIQDAYHNKSIDEKEFKEAKKHFEKESNNLKIPTNKEIQKQIQKQVLNLPIESFFEDKFIENLIKKFFEFYIYNQFYKTKLFLKLFLKLIPNAKNFLNSYDQIITTNYNDYYFLNKNIINIHGKIDNEKEPIIWYEKNKEKENWSSIIQSRKLTMEKYNEIDLMGISLKNDEHTLMDVINHANNDDDLIINYYAFDDNDKKYFSKIIYNILKKYEIKLISSPEDKTYFEFPKQGYILNENSQQKTIQIFIKDNTDFWGFANKEVNEKWNKKHEYGENTKRFNLSPYKFNFRYKETINYTYDTFFNHLKRFIEENKNIWIEYKKDILKKIDSLKETSPYKLFTEFTEIFYKTVNENSNATIDNDFDNTENFEQETN